MIILGLESSCDETAAAVVKDGFDVKASLISSQVELHAEYGGVVPELAAREHLRNLGPLVDTALERSGTAAGQLDGIAVTCTPGLAPALLVGLNYAKGMALAGGLPLIGVNHFTAHVYSCFLDNQEALRNKKNFPLLALVVSGGHTSLIILESDGTSRIIGRTVDDAAGEAFDKGAKILQLGYPGGPLIEQIAAEGDPARYKFPRGLSGGSGKAVSAKDRFNFSFSGLKTALLYETRKHPELDSRLLADLSASYQAAIIEVLVRKTVAAAEEYGVSTVLLCGGVAGNRGLRRVLQWKVEESEKKFIVAPPCYCTDNAAMVAGLGWHELKHGRIADMSLDAQPRLPAVPEPAAFAPAFNGSRQDASLNLNSAI